MPARRHWGLIALAEIFLTSVVGYILNGHRSSPAAGTAGLILAGATLTALHLHHRRQSPVPGPQPLDDASPFPDTVEIGRAHV